MRHLRSFVIIALALALAGCGDNLSAPPTSTHGIAQANVSGALVATSAHYRVVSTVSPGEMVASSAAHTVTSGIATQAGPP